MGHSIARSVCMILTVAAVCFHVVVAIRSAWRHGWLRIDLGVRLISRGRSWITSAFAFRKEDALLETAIREEMCRRSVDRCRLVSKILSRVVCLLTLPQIMKEFSSQERLLSLGQDVAILATLVMTGLCSARPHLIRSSTLDLVYSLWMVLVMCYFGLFANSVGIAHLASSVVTRMVYILAYSRIPLVIFWNVSCSLVFVITFQPQEGSDDGFNVAMFEFSLCVCYIAFGIGARRHWHHEVSKEINDKTFRDESCAVKTLLDATCDLVIEIDAELRIASGTSKFNALMMTGPDQSSKGRDLRHFMASDEDWKQVVSGLLSSPSDPQASVVMPFAGAVHAKMRDSIGNVLDMEIFHASFKGLDGRLRHVAGMREFAETRLAPLRSEPEAETGDEQPFAAEEVPDSPSTTELGASQDFARGVRLRPEVAVRAPRPAVAMLEKGTPPQPQRESLQDPSSMSAAGQSASSPRSSECSQNLLTSRFGRTSDRAMMVSVLNMVQYWNVKMSRHACCPFHAAIEECLRTVFAMKRRRCVPNFVPQGTIQCENCGVLGWEGEWDGQLCTVCFRRRSSGAEQVRTILPL